MRIQHNITALNAHRQLGGNNSQVGKNLEKLSSGYKINRAGDDAAGLAISEKMRAQIRGLETAQKNANDGISLVQTAEGALTEVHSMLNRMVELATQSANGIYTDVDRGKLQDEVKALKEEIDRISQATNFNGINLLDGSMTKATDFLTATAGTSITTNALGSVNTTLTGGGLTPGATGSVYSTSIAWKDLVVGAVAGGNGDGKISIAWKDSTGAAGTPVDITIAAAGQTVTAGNVVTALNTNGAFSTDYTASLDTSGNIVITSNSKDVDFGGIAVTFTEDSAAGSNALATARAAQQITNGDGTTALVGDKVHETAGANVGVASYDVKSTTLTLAGTPATDWTEGIQVKIGSKTYTYTKDPSQVTAGGTKFTGTTLDDIARSLASVATASAGANGSEFNVTRSANGVLTIEETMQHANTSIASNSTTASTALAANKIVIQQAGSVATTDVTIDPTKLVDGSQLKIGSSTYTFVKQSTGAANEIVFSSADTKGSIATKLATAIGSSATATGDVVNVRAAVADVKAVNSNTLKLQVGDTNDSFQRVSVSISDMSSNGIGISSVDISTKDLAGDSISKIKSAIEQVSSARGGLGALQNRLEHTINNLGVTTENLTAAESRVRDVDMAKEMMDFTKNNILTQASQAMLAQANQLPQGVLQLLR